MIPPLLLGGDGLQATFGRIRRRVPRCLEKGIVPASYWWNLIVRIGPRGEHIVPSSWWIGLANLIESNVQGGRNLCGGRGGRERRPPLLLLLMPWRPRGASLLTAPPYQPWTWRPAPSRDWFGRAWQTWGDQRRQCRRLCRGRSMMSTRGVRLRSTFCEWGKFGNFPPCPAEIIPPLLLLMRTLPLRLLPHPHQSPLIRVPYANCATPWPDTVLFWMCQSPPPHHLPNIGDFVLPTPSSSFLSLYLSLYVSLQTFLSYKLLIYWWPDSVSSWYLLFLSLSTYRISNTIIIIHATVSPSQVSNLCCCAPLPLYWKFLARADLFSLL